METLTAGTIAPNVTLLDQNGNEITLLSDEDHAADHFSVWMKKFILK